MGLFDSKRPKSALMRDRAYKSNEPHEQVYVRKTRPKNPRYMANGGGVGKGLNVGDNVRFTKEFYDYQSGSGHNRYGDTDYGVLKIREIDDEQKDSNGDFYLTLSNGMTMPKEWLQKTSDKIGGSKDIKTNIGNNGIYADGGMVDLSKYVDRIGSIEYGVLEPNGHQVVHHLNQAMGSDDREEMIDHLAQARGYMPISINKYSYLALQINDIINDLDEEYADGGYVDDGAFSLGDKVEILDDIDDLGGYEIGDVVEVVAIDPTFYTVKSSDGNFFYVREEDVKLARKARKSNWFTTTKPNEKQYVLYDFARSVEQAKNMLRDLREGSPIAHKSDSEGGEYNIYVKKGSVLWRESGGSVYADGGSIEENKRMAVETFLGGLTNDELYYVANEYADLDWDDDANLDNQIQMWIKSLSNEDINMMHEELLGYRNGGRVYKTGRAYKTDRARFNKSEDWEIPMNKRSGGSKTTMKAPASKSSTAPSTGKSKYSYIPNAMLREAEVENKGKTTYIDGADILDGIYVKKGTKYADGGGLDLFVTPKGRNVEYKGKSGGTHKELHKYKWVDMPSEYSKVISGNGQFKNKINPIVADEMIDSMIINYNKFKDEKYAKGGGVDYTDYKSLLEEERRLYAEYNKVKADYDREYKEDEFDSLLAQEYKQKMEMLEGEMMEVNNDLLYLQTHGIEKSMGSERMKDGGRVKKYNYVPNRMIQAIEVERNGKTTEIDGANILDGIYVKGKVKFADGGMADGGEVKSMKEMMDSCYTYGGLDKGSYNYERYILPYKGRLGEKMFDKVYNQYSDLLKSDYEVEGNTYTDSEGLTYNTLKKKYAKGGDKYADGGGIGKYVFTGREKELYDKYISEYNNYITGEQPRDIVFYEYLSIEAGHYLKGNYNHNLSVEKNIEIGKEIINLRDKIWATDKTYDSQGNKYANGGMMDYGSDLTDESTIRGNITNGEIHCDTLTEIIGCEPNYPCHNVGSLKLTKCFLRPYYKIG